MRAADKMRNSENEMGKGQVRPARQRGRPALPTEEVKRHALGIRTTKGLKDALQHAAESSGRSVAQEIEFRLEQSFRQEAYARDLREMLALALGADVAAITLAMGLAIRDVARWGQLPPNTNLLSDPFIFNQARAAVSRVIDSVKPEGDPARLPGHADMLLPETQASAEQWRMLGPDIGAQVCWRIANQPEQLGPWGSSIQEWLGPEAIERIRTKIERQNAEP
jgi:hypothetical protein